MLLLLLAECRARWMDPSARFSTIVKTAAPSCVAVASKTVSRIVPPVYLKVSTHL